MLPKLHSDADYPCDLVGNWNTWYGEQDQAGEGCTSAGADNQTTLHGRDPEGMWGESWPLGRGAPWCFPLLPHLAVPSQCTSGASLVGTQPSWTA